MTMLGVKTTAKDRWRQIMPEAEKISQKHLITLEPGISRNQTTEMIANNVQLIIPKTIQNSYTEDQQKMLISLKDFVSIVTEREQKSGKNHLLF